MLPCDLSADGFVEFIHRDSAARDGGLDAADHDIDVLRFLQNIGSSEERTDASFFLSEVQRQSAHRHRIRDDEALESHFFAKNVGLHFGRKRCRNRRLLRYDLGPNLGITALINLQRFDLFAVDQRQSDVGYHDRADTGVYRFLERNEFERIEPRFGQIDDRKAAMRIDICIAMAGEMLGCCDDLLRLNAFGKSGSKTSDVVRIFAEAADVDNGISGVIINVQHRCVHVADSDRLCFTARYNAHATSEFRITGRSDGHCPGEVGRVLEAHSDASFGIQRHQ